MKTKLYRIPIVAEFSIPDDRVFDHNQARELLELALDKCQDRDGDWFRTVLLNCCTPKLVDHELDQTDTEGENVFINLAIADRPKCEDCGADVAEGCGLQKPNGPLIHLCQKCTTKRICGYVTVSKLRDEAKRRVAKRTREPAGKR
jgi:hypothetical protein